MDNAARVVVRIRFGLAMAPKGGRTAIVGVEVRERRSDAGRLEHRFEVGLCELLPTGTIEAAAARVLDLLVLAQDRRPCVIVDTSSPQGLALHRHLRSRRLPDLHPPHAWAGSRTRLFGTFLAAYADGRIGFVADLPNRTDLDRSLMLYLGGARRGAEPDQGEEAPVIALSLAVSWPTHGPAAREIPANPVIQR